MKISTISMKKIVKNFNNFIKNIIFKVHNKTNNKLNKSNFNKFLITFICTLFLYIFYLLIPLLYEKNWVKDNIQTKLLSEFKIDINHIDNISYRILPAPHFLITDSEIMSSSSKDKKPIARIKDLKIFLDQMNFFNKEKMSIKEMVINKANFFLLRNDIKFLNDSLNRNFSNKKIKINKSNVFLKNPSAANPPPNLNNAAPNAALPIGDLAIFLTPRVTFLTSLPRPYICLADSRSMIPPS